MYSELMHYKKIKFKLIIHYRLFFLGDLCKRKGRNWWRWPSTRLLKSAIKFQSWARQTRLKDCVAAIERSVILFGSLEFIMRKLGKLFGRKLDEYF